jgi:prepilin-type N-terminal cleavage/methylation domain-containing protein
MNGKWWTTTRRRGLTLVEVVAGLALLSTLLVAVLTAKARATRQWTSANRRLEAVAAADRMLVGWWQDRAKFPRASSGHVTGDVGLAWRTSTVQNEAVNALQASVIRMEILDERVSPPVVLASVEIVLDDAPPTDAVKRVLTRGETP